MKRLEQYETPFNMNEFNKYCNHTTGWDFKKCRELCKVLKLEFRVEVISNITRFIVDIDKQTDLILESVKKPTCTTSTYYFNTYNIPEELVLTKGDIVTMENGLQAEMVDNKIGVNTTKNSKGKAPAIVFSKLLQERIKAVLDSELQLKYKKGE